MNLGETLGLAQQPETERKRQNQETVKDQGLQSPHTSEQHFEIKETRRELSSDNHNAANSRNRIDSLFPPLKETAVTTTINEKLLLDTGVKERQATYTSLKVEGTKVGTDSFSASKAEASGHAVRAQNFIAEASSKLELATEFIQAGRSHDAEATIGAARELERKARQETELTDKNIELARKQIAEQVHREAMQQDLATVLDLRHLFGASKESREMAA